MRCNKQFAELYNLRRVLSQNEMPHFPIRYTPAEMNLAKKQTWLLGVIGTLVTGVLVIGSGRDVLSLFTGTVCGADFVRPSSFIGSVCGSGCVGPSTSIGIDWWSGGGCSSSSWSCSCLPSADNKGITCQFHHVQVLTSSSIWHATWDATVTRFSTSFMRASWPEGGLCAAFLAMSSDEGSRVSSAEISDRLLFAFAACHKNPVLSNNQNLQVYLTSDWMSVVDTL